MRIINTFGQLVAAGGLRIAILYRGRGDSRSINVPSWQVMCVKDGTKIVTDPKAAWYDMGMKTFLLGGPIREKKGQTLQVALAWVKGVYGYDDFVRNAHGNYVERHVNVFKLERPHR